MHRLFAANWFSPPPLGKGLWLTLAGLLAGAINLIYLAEIWPHTPAAKSALLTLEWLLLLALLPQGLWWAWRWRRAYPGPGWLRLLVLAVFLGGACLVLAVWVVVVMGGLGAALFGLEKLSFS